MSFKEHWLRQRLESYPDTREGFAVEKSEPDSTAEDVSASEATWDWVPQ